MKAEPRIILFLSLSFIVGLGLGLVSNYYFFNSKIEAQEHRINELENEIFEYETLNSHLSQEIETLRTQIDLLETQLADYKYNQGLLEQFNNSQRIPFTLDAGEKGEDNVTISFNVGYGLIMDAYVNLVKNEYESSIDIELSWKRGASRGFLVGLGNANAESASTVNGIAYCEVYDDPNDNKLVVKIGAFIKEYPWIEKSRVQFFSK